MPTLSIVMIVKNEAHCLADCLSSVHAIADEVVVGDTGSQDETMNIAKGFGARILEVPWKDDFADARNRVLAAASGAWLLHLDADETLDPASARTIRQLVDADGSGADGIWATLANYCNRHELWRWVPVEPGDPHARGYAGYIATELVRLYRGDRGYEYREPVHENLGTSLAERGAILRREPIKIHHYGFDPDLERNKKKVAHYLQIAHKKVKTNPGDMKAWFDLAAASLDCGDVKTGEEAAKRTLELSPEFIDAGALLVDVYMRRGDYGPARTLLRSFTRRRDAPALFTVALGVISSAEGNLEEARKELESALEANPKLVVGYLHLARVYDQTSDGSRARAELEKAHKLAPALDEPRHRLEALDLREMGEAQYQNGDPLAALRCFTQALKLDSRDPLLYNDAGAVFYEMGDIAKAKESFENALKLAPGLATARTNLQAVEEMA